MFDFGDELIIESYRVPWLIWIQILVLCLLLFLLCLAGVFASDLCSIAETCSTSSAALLSGESCRMKPPLEPGTATANRLLIKENPASKREAAIITGRRDVREEDAPEREAPSAKETARHFIHPCSYIRRARLAFLKCLGLDPDGSSSGERNRRN